MVYRLIKDEKECLRRMIEYLNKNTLQFVDGLHTESNKIRCLLNAVIGKKWATSTMKNTSTAQYNLNKRAMVLNVSIQLEHEIENATTYSKTYYGQLTTYPKSICKYDSLHMNNQEIMKITDLKDTTITI